MRVVLDRSGFYCFSAENHFTDADVSGIVRTAVTAVTLSPWGQSVSGHAGTEELSS